MKHRAGWVTLLWACIIATALLLAAVPVMRALARRIDAQTIIIQEQWRAKKAQWDEELQVRLSTLREAGRQGLVRGVTIGVAVLVVVIGLAVLAPYVIVSREVVKRLVHRWRETHPIYKQATLKHKPRKPKPPPTRSGAIEL